jgi:hypothetical protein
VPRRGRDPRRTSAYDPPHPLFCCPPRRKRHAVGELAQLGERLVCNQEVTGSSPVFSTRFAVDAFGRERLVFDN